MDTVSCVDEKENPVNEKPGAQLAFIRAKKGHTPEFVASKLNMRVRLIELLEADVYDQLPQPVFVKGYIRAYAKFLGVSSEPFIASFNNLCVEERKLERTLWQSRREPSIHERLVRWITGLIVLAIILSMTFLWKRTNDSAENVLHSNKSDTTKTTQKSTKDYLTQVSKIQSLFKPTETTEALPESSGD